jgi:hypothetical protein
MVQLPERVKRGDSGVQAVADRSGPGIASSRRDARFETGALAVPAVDFSPSSSYQTGIVPSKPGRVEPVTNSRRFPEEMPDQ